jgi:hypothetical protein
MKRDPLPVVVGVLLGFLVGALVGILLNNPWSRGFWLATALGVVLGLGSGLALYRRIG